MTFKVVQTNFSELRKMPEVFQQMFSRKLKMIKDMLFGIITGTYDGISSPPQRYMFQKKDSPSKVDVQCLSMVLGVLQNH